jgi:hypothetical protein
MDMFASLLMQDYGGTDTKIGEVLRRNEVSATFAETSLYEDYLSMQADLHLRFNPNLTRVDNARPVIVATPADHIDATLAACSRNEWGVAPFSITGRQALHPVLYEVFVAPVVRDTSFEGLEEILGGTCLELHAAYLLWSWRNIWQQLREEWACDPRMALVAIVIATARVRSDRIMTLDTDVSITPQQYIAMFVKYPPTDEMANACVLAHDIVPIPTHTYTRRQLLWKTEIMRRNEETVVDLDTQCGECDADTQDAVQTKIIHYLATGIVMARFQAIVYFENMGTREGASGIFYRGKSIWVERLSQKPFPVLYARFVDVHCGHTTPLEQTQWFDRVMATSIVAQNPLVRQSTENAISGLFIRGNEIVICDRYAAEASTYVRKQNRFSLITQPLYLATTELASLHVSSIAATLLSENSGQATVAKTLEIISEITASLLDGWAVSYRHIHAFDFILSKDGSNRCITARWAFEQGIFITFMVNKGVDVETANQTYWKLVEEFAY